VEILGTTMSGLLDSGASCTVLGKGALELASRLGLCVFEKENASVKTADGTRHSVAGYIYVPFSFDGRLRIIPTLLIPTLNRELILGIDFWENFDIKPVIQVSHPSDQNEIFEIGQSTNVKTDHSLTFLQESRLKKILEKLQPKSEKIIPTKLMTHKIDTGEAQPVQSKPYQFSPAIEKKIHAEIDRMLNLGVIERSQSPWRNPIVVVPKSEDRVRLCLDSRKLNAVTVKDAYVIPNLNRILGRLNETKCLSTIDMADSFWQIGLDDSSKLKTAFSIPGRGLFHFKVLPFGLSNSAQCLGRLMDMVLHNEFEPNVFIYVDDIIICSNDLDSHLDLLEKVTDKLVGAGLKVNLEKTKFCQKELKYLGYVLDEEGLRTDPSKVTAVVNFPAPKTLRELRRFIGMCGWYRRFIENFATLISPMSELLKIKTKHCPKTPHKFSWTKEADQAFIKAKQVLVSAPVLTNPDYKRPFVIHADASDIGVGGVLSQKQGEEGEKPCAYFSAKLTSAERKYTTTEKECLAVLLSIENFRPYVDGTKFTVVTDHSALLWLLKMKTPPSPRLARWILRLQGFNFDVIHRKGKEHVVPDALSRIPDETLFLDILDVVSSDDEWYSKLIKKVSSNPENYSEFKVDGKNLFKFCRLPNDFGDQDFVWKTVVPADYRTEIMRRSHDECGHLGVFKTANRIRQRFYWPKLQEDVQAYIRRCDACRSSKDLRTTQRPPMGQQKIATRPWQIISMDFVGKFPRSSHQNTQLLVIYDWFSKYVIVKPMRAALTQKLCDFLEYEVFLTHSVPQQLISDNGSQFVSKQFQALLKKYNIKHTPNARYHSQHNPAERTNGVIGAAIRCYLGTDHKKWDQELKRITFAMNTSVNAVTKVTPHFLVYGKELKIDGQEYSDEPVDTEKYAREIADDLVKARKFVIEQMKKSHDTSKRRYDLRTREISYQPGEIVWRTNFQLSDATKDYSAKLGKRRVKCIILRKVGNSCYELGNLQGKSLGIFHAKDLCKS